MIPPSEPREWRVTQPTENREQLYWTAGEFVPKATLDACRAERDEWIKRYKAIECANIEWSRNDHVKFGEAILERDALKAECERLKQNNLLEAVCAADIDLREENARLREALEQIRTAATQGDETTTELNCHHIADEALKERG